MLVSINFVTAISVNLFWFCEKLLIRMNTWMNGKNQRSIITLKRRFLQYPKYGRYYWCRLQTCKKYLQRLWHNKLGKYHNLYGWSNTVLMAIAFESFLNMCLEIYELVPGHSFTAPGLAWQAVLNYGINKFNNKYIIHERFWSK